MKEELAEYVNKIPCLSPKRLLNNEAYLGDWGGQPVVIVQSGVGKVNAAMIVQYLINSFPLKAVICQGVAGAVSPMLNIGDIVLGEHHIQHDIDVTALGFRKGEIPYQNLHIFPGDRSLLQKATDACNKLGLPYTAGTIVTGDQFVSDPEVIHRLRQDFAAHAVDMEGGAIAQVCHANSIPFLSIKSISDRADRNASADFPVFIRAAAAKSFQLVEAVVLT